MRSDVEPGRFLAHMTLHLAVRRGAVSELDNDLEKDVIDDEPKVGCRFMFLVILIIPRGTP